jgi:hypothetical protein
MRSLAIVVAAAMATSGCLSFSKGPLLSEEGDFSAKSIRATFAGATAARADVQAAADENCANAGKKIVLVSRQTQVWLTHASVDLKYRCQ